MASDLIFGEGLGHCEGRVEEVYSLEYTADRAKRLKEREKTRCTVDVFKSPDQ